METPQLPVISIGATSRQLYTSIAVSKESFATPLLSPFVCAIAAVSGYPWCWGHFPLTNYTLWTPTRIPGERMFISISSGGTFACGLDNTGIIACWSGVLSEPIVISSNTFSGLALGVNSTCGLTGTTVLCWGSNLMLDKMIPNPMAVVAVGAQGFVSISAGPSMTCGVATTADIWCWSVGSDGTSIGAVRKAIGPFSLVSVGKDAACAVDFYGHASCWGVNLYNWLGIEDTSAIVTTASPVRGLSAFQSISVGSAPGEAHVCGILRRGGLVCWGATAFGRTGTGFSAGTLTLPTDVVTSAMQPVSSSIAHSISSGASFTCALYSDQSLLVEGQNNDQWACINQGWQYIWDGHTCIRAPNCYELGTDVSWDGNSCSLNFAPASCIDSDYKNYDPLQLSCGAPTSNTLGNWLTPTMITNGSSTNDHLITLLPNRNTPLGASMMVDETGNVTVFLSTTLRSITFTVFNAALTRTAFGDAMFVALSDMGLQTNTSNALLVISNVREIIMQIDDGVSDAPLRCAAITTTTTNTTTSGYLNSSSLPASRRRRVESIPALVIEFYISSHDANFILQTASLGIFASNSSTTDTTTTTTGVQPSLSTISAAYLGSAFISSFTGALQATAIPVFERTSILSLNTMPGAVPSTSLTPSPSTSTSASFLNLELNSSYIDSSSINIAATQAANVSGSLSVGAIVGIVIGALTAVICIAFILCKSKRQREVEGEGVVFISNSILTMAAAASNEAIRVQFSEAEGSTTNIGSSSNMQMSGSPVTARTSVIFGSSFRVKSLEEHLPHAASSAASPAAQASSSSSVGFSPTSARRRARH